MTEPFADPRGRELATAAGERFDLIVIGGGINGAGIARDAALRGLAVLLLERDDFGFGTTWRSTKLIHGGLRYLQYGEFRLVFEGLHERAVLLRTAPHLVRPLPFLIPIYRGARYGRHTVGAGLWLYDLLALGRFPAGHRALAPARVVQLEPGLRRAGLTGGFLYHDAQAALPERLCLENVLGARDAGAAAFNHIEVTAVHAAGGRVTGVRARDAETGTAIDFRGRVVVNAAGPWVDRVLGTGAIRRRLLSTTKGSHIVADLGAAGPRRALYAEAGADGRPIFIIPWRGRHLIGTTDLPFADDPAAVRPTTREVAYLLREAQRLLPGVPLDEQRILYAFAGVRPLVHAHRPTTAAISRRHVIHDHERDGYAGLLSIVGGKLTGYRHLAEQTVNMALRRLGYGRRPSRTATAPLVPGTPPPGRDPLTRHLGAVYGARATRVLALAAADPRLARPLCAHGPDIAAQAVAAVRYEGARTVGDVLLRRTPAGWERCRGLDAAPTVAALLGDALGWDAPRRQEAVAAYRAEVDRALPPLACLRD